MILKKPEKHNSPVIKLNLPDDSFKFQPLPKPSGAYPYHLSLDAIAPADANKIVFHMVGDTGSIRGLAFQEKVVGAMLRQFEKGEDHPDFLFHLGDVVYNHGEASRYYEQFFAPYSKYPRPIFAIPGNHDCDVNMESPVSYSSLEPFMAVFCDTERRRVSFSGDTNWTSMIQPNVFWTLETPVANFIGLQSNVPKFGIITEEQKAWFVEELKLAATQRPEKAIIVCIHHAPYSADINHGASLKMIEVLESSFAEAQVKPDVVFSGHVHNYQRFEKEYEDGEKTSFIVAGGGGYDQLHSIVNRDDENFTADHPFFEGVRLINYCDSQHGFLKVKVERTEAGIEIGGEYHAILQKVEGEAFQTSVVDTFKLLAKEGVAI
ncbi:metallophosphoesterase family protein [Desertivirga arenae]|uniref:metallophosphoesterase family protein n=1 Tax=Desertivirga arenae TaxID=2810309 RepID=UPI001F60211D|nr:metallophosphoesterase [Pedobacter sp. SYSU D00823]